MSFLVDFSIVYLVPGLRAVPAVLMPSLKPSLKHMQSLLGGKSWSGALVLGLSSSNFFDSSALPGEGGFFLLRASECGGSVG